MSKKAAAPVLWEYNDKNFKMCIRMHGKSRVRYCGVLKLPELVGEERANYIRNKMENLKVDKKIFKVQGKATVYVYMR